MRDEIHDARNAFIRKYDGQAPNMLVIHPEAWEKLCAELDLRGVLLDKPTWTSPVAVFGMQTYISSDVRGFVVGMSLGAGA